MVKMKKKFGFSLAEILLTLAIIGVVAAMTIPVLMRNYQNQEYATRLKKAYTITNQTLQQIAADAGCTGDLACTGLFASSLTDPHNVLGNELTKYINTAKNCKTATNQGCWTNSTNYNYDGTHASNANYDAEGLYKFTTTDGMSFIVSNYKNNCITDGSGATLNYSTGRTGNMKQTCGSVFIDINGPKKPNFWGKDTFAFFITNGKGPLLYPLGGADCAWSTSIVGDYWWLNPADGKTPRYCSKTSKGGTFCAGRVMEEGWEINY